MKRKGIALVIFGILVGVNVAVSLLLTERRDAVFWTGFAFMVLSLCLAALTMAVSMKERQSSFPFELSMAGISLLYVFAVFLINVLLGTVFRPSLNAFFSVHLICLAILVVLTLLMTLTKTKIAQELADTNRKLSDWHNLIADYQTVSLKLSQLPDVSAKQLRPLMNALLDDLNFADFSTSADTGAIDQALIMKAQTLSAEADNLVSIQAEDVGALAESIKEIRQLIQERTIRLQADNHRI